MSARIFRLRDYEHRPAAPPPAQPATVIILPVVRVERPLEQPRRRRRMPPVLGPHIIIKPRDA